MSCPVCHESRYWSPQTGCLICQRKKAGEQYAVSLTQEEWESLRTGGFVERTLRSRHQDILIVIQREE